MSPSTNLDFIVIGAMKSGTTTLHKRLLHNKAIALPYGKEVPYFSDAQRYRAGWEPFVATMYPDTHGKTVGKVSPQYMAYPGCAERIKAQFPDVKLIAILRERAARLKSHYRMCYSLGIEKRPLDEVLRHSLQEEELQRVRVNPTPNTSYVVWGEYGRILTAYFDNFPRENILLLKTADLRSRPAALMQTILRHVGIDGSAAGDMGDNVTALEGGYGSIFIRNVDACARRVGLNKLANLCPPALRKKIGFFLLSHRATAIQCPADYLTISPDTAAGLQRLYAQDDDRLHALAGLKIEEGA